MKSSEFFGNLWIVLKITFTAMAKLHKDDRLPFWNDCKTVTFQMVGSFFLFIFSTTFTLFNCQQPHGFSNECKNHIFSRSFKTNGRIKTTIEKKLKKHTADEKLLTWLQHFIFLVRDFFYSRCFGPVRSFVDSRVYAIGLNACVYNISHHISNVVWTARPYSVCMPM